jgi:hypothetical protein
MGTYRGRAAELVPAVSTIVELQSGEMLLDTPWYRQISREQRRAFWATFLGWVVDAFDFNILAFVLIDIQRTFAVGSRPGRRVGNRHSCDACCRRHRCWHGSG